MSESEKNKCSIKNPIACIKNFFESLSGKAKELYAVEGLINNDCKTYNYNRTRRTVLASQTPFNPAKDILGKSVGGIDTSLTIPKFGITLDAGISILDLVPENRIFISHTDGDHIAGIKGIMCESIKRDKPFDIYISKEGREFVEGILNRMKEKNEGIKVNFHYVSSGDIVPIDDSTRFEFFDVIHTPSSIGLSILKKDDETGDWNRKLTYTGDVSISLMRQQGLIEKTPQMVDTETLIIENSIPSVMTSIIPILEFANARHSSVSDVNWLVDKGNKGKQANIKNLVLVHTLGLPPFLVSCSDQKIDLVSHFLDNNFNVYYLTACRKNFKPELGLMTAQPVIE